MPRRKGFDNDQILAILTSTAPENSEDESFKLDSEDEYDPQNDDCSNDSDVSNQDETDLDTKLLFHIIQQLLPKLIFIAYIYIQISKDRINTYSLFFDLYFTAEENETEGTSSRTVVMSVDQLNFESNSSCQGYNSEFSNQEETELFRN